MGKCSAQVRNILIKCVGHNGHTYEMCQQFKGVGAKAEKQQNWNGKREQCVTA